MLLKRLQNTVSFKFLKGRGKLSFEFLPFDLMTFSLTGMKACICLSGFYGLLYAYHAFVIILFTISGVRSKRSAIAFAEKPFV